MCASSVEAAVINVKTRGARGNGIADDTNAVNRAISKSAPGDTIFFPAGKYRIASSAGIVLEPNRSYKGDTRGESVLLGSGGYTVAGTKYNLAFNVIVASLVFDGGGLRTEGKEVPARGLSVTGCTFRNIVSDGENWTAHMGIFLAAGAEQSHFDHNRFTNIFTGARYGLEDADATGIFSYGLSDSTITDNTFDYLNEGVHIFFDKTDGADVLVARNTFTRVHRITMEFQHDNTDGLVVRDNMVSNPLNPYWLTYGISVSASATGKGILVANNTVVANTPLDLTVNPKNYYPYGLEVAGAGTVVTGNRVIGLWGTGIGVGYARNLRLEKNLICGKVTTYNRSIEQYHGPQPGTVMTGNTIAPQCPSAEEALFKTR